MTPDTLGEIWETLRRHKLRTGLTMLSVAWGVLVLIVLLGAGRGLERGAASTFRRDALNAVWISPGTTSEPFGGRGPGRAIRFDRHDYETLRALGPGIEYASGVALLKGATHVRAAGKHATFDLRGVWAEHRFLELAFAERGRFLSPEDVALRRKVVVIGKEVAAFFFGKKDPVGEWMAVGNAFYRVIGVYGDRAGAEEERSMYAPITTIDLVNGNSGRLEDLGVTVNGSFEESLLMVEAMRKALAERHDFSPEDRRAVRLFNALEFSNKIKRIFRWITVFVWMVGIGTLLAGIVGVSNLMLISVRERTKEIGIRKALGATPASIVSLIVEEAVIITIIAGYVGLVTGLGIVDFAGRFIPEKGFMGVPEVDLGVAVSATALIVVSGVLAGFFPARLAAKVTPITALRSE